MKAPELGVRIGAGEPGPHDAVTDVAGVRVGHTTLIEGEDVRTGVTIVFPHDGDPAREPVFAGCHRLNGNGELTGLEWIRESGLLTTPIGLTNTHSVGVVRDAIVEWGIRQGLMGEDAWSLPVVGETWDGRLNDINGLHVHREHVFAALETAASGPVAEGNVGSGTGMICHGFKGGIGTASRVTGGHTVGVLVQANHGARERLAIEGVPVGRELPHGRIPEAGHWAPDTQASSADLPRPGPPGPSRSGSIIVLVATDAPLLPHQLDRIAQRAALGVARLGGAGENGSGDLVLAFSTANDGLAGGGVRDVRMLGNDAIDRLFYATIDATEEAIVNAMLQAETMTGKGGTTVHRLDPELLLEVMRRHGRA